MRTKHNFWQNSQCIGQYLHRFEIKENYPEGVLEVCEICHKRKFFRLIEGRISNAEYMSYHIRQSLLPFHPYYDHERNYDPLDNPIASPYA